MKRKMSKGGETNYACDFRAEMLGELNAGHSRNGKMKGKKELRRFFLLFIIGLMVFFSLSTLYSCRNEPDKTVPPAEEVGPSSEKKLPLAQRGTMSEEEKEAVAREKGSVIEEIPLEE